MTESSDPGLLPHTRPDVAPAAASAPARRPTLGERLHDFINGAVDPTIVPTADDVRVAEGVRDGAASAPRSTWLLFVKNTAFLAVLIGVFLPLLNGESLVVADPRRLAQLLFITLPFAAIQTAVERSAYRRSPRDAQRYLRRADAPSLEETARRVASRRRELTAPGWLRRALLRAARTSAVGAAILTPFFRLLSEPGDPPIVWTFGVSFAWLLAVSVPAFLVGRRLFLANWERGRHYVPLPSDVGESVAGGRVGIPHADSAPVSVPPHPRG